MMNRILLYITICMIALSACGRDDYFDDTGVHDPVFNGTIMDYLDSRAQRPIDPFDTLVQIIRLAGLEQDFKTKTFTFFAPPDPSIRKSIEGLNVELKNLGRDTVQKLEQVSPETWSYFLKQYMLKEDLGLIDFPQVDTAALNAFRGRVYQTFNEQEPLNVGLVYHDLVNGGSVIKYQGPRQLLISYIPDFSTPLSGWVNAFISSSNIKPHNGRVHVINYNRHLFGFNSFRFSSKALELGVSNMIE